MSGHRTLSEWDPASCSVKVTTTALRQVTPPLKVTHLPPLLAQQSLHGHTALSYSFMIQEFRGSHPFSSTFPSHGHLDINLSLAAHHFATLTAGAWLRRLDGWH